MNKIHFKTKNIQDSLKDKIQKAYQEVMPIIENKLDLPDINIYIYDDTTKTISETGIGGNSVDQNTIYINIDLNFPDIEKDIEGKIKSTLAHEINHCVRSTKYYWGQNLLEAVITEGLADHFDLEINGGEVKPWCRVLSDEKTLEYFNETRLDFENSDYDHSKWFFGTNPEIPKWAGYSIGFKLVEDYLESNNKKASEVTLLDSKKFIK